MKVRGVETVPARKVSKTERAENMAMVGKLEQCLRALATIKKHQPTHWALTFKSGKVVNLWPGILAAGPSTPAHRFANAFDLLVYLATFTEPRAKDHEPGPEDDDWDVFED